MRRMASSERQHFSDPEGDYYEFEPPVAGASYATGADWEDGTRDGHLDEPVARTRFVSWPTSISNAGRCRG